MYIRVKTTPNSPRKSVQIVSCVRRGDKVSQQIQRHVGIAMDDQELASLKVLARQIIEKLKEEEQPSFPMFAPESLQKKEAIEEAELKVDLRDLREEQRTIEGIHEIGGALFHELGFDKLFGKSKRSQGTTEVLKNVVLARLAQPVSKFRTAQLLENDFGIRVPVDRIYRMMDQIVPRIEDIKEAVARQSMGLLGGNVDVLLYDVTTLAFESQRSDELRNFGYSKDKKFNEVQVVLALATTKEGLPVWYEVFEGNTAETKTMIPALKQLSKRFSVKDIICVADRAMLNSDNVKELEDCGFRYVLGKRLRTMSVKQKNEILECKNKKDCSSQFSFEVALRGTERLIVVYSPERAAKDQADRARTLDKLRKKLKSNKTHTASLISNKTAKKFMVEEIQGEISLNSTKIKEDAKWDGLYGICSNDPSLTHEKIISIYKNLWHIEAAFRLSKHDLKMRPIYHYNADRIKAHCAICFLTFSLAKHLEHRVLIQQTSMSFAKIQQILFSVQATILRHVSTKALYKIPSKMCLDAKKIYSAMGIKRSVIPSKIY